MPSFFLPKTFASLSCLALLHSNKIFSVGYSHQRVHTGGSAMSNGIIINKGQVVFQFVFDIAWEIRISKLCASDIFTKLQWEEMQESIAPSRYRNNTPNQVSLELSSEDYLPFRDTEVQKYKIPESWKLVLDDSGAIALQFTLEFENMNLEDLVKDSESFHENDTLLANARRIAQNIQSTIFKFLHRPRIDIEVTDDFEDYIIYRLFDVFSQEMIDQNKILLASLIDGKKESLLTATDDATNEYAEEVLENRLAHPRAGTTIANWSGAISLGGSWDGIISIILYANMELLELRLLARHLEEENDELDKLSCSWLYASLRPSTWVGGSLLIRVLQTKKDVKGQLARIKNPLVRFGNRRLARIYEELKEIFLIDHYMEQIGDELEELKDSESTITERSSARRQDILALFGVLVAFEYVTSGVSSICQGLLNFVIRKK